MRKKQKEHAESGSIGAKIFRYAIMAIVLFISLYPILWVLISSFKEKPGGLGLPENGCLMDILLFLQNWISKRIS